MLNRATALLNFADADAQFQRRYCSISPAEALNFNAVCTLIFNSGDKSVTINDILLSEIEANDTKAEGLFIDKVGLPYREDITDLSCILLFFAETLDFSIAQGYNYIRE